MYLSNDRSIYVSEDINGYNHVVGLGKQSMVVSASNFIVLDPDD